MKALLLCALSALMLCTQTSLAQSGHKSLNRYYQLPENLQADEYMPGTITFKLKEAYRNDIENGQVNLPKLASFLSEIGAYDVHKRFPTAERPTEEFDKAGHAYADLTRIYEFHFSEDYSLEGVINRLYHLGYIEYAEPHFIDKLDLNVNDPSLSQQWHINKINAPDAWDTETGSSDIIIAIVDSGADEQHEDLVPNYHYNTADPVNGVDDDNDGYVDNNLGWDFVDNDHTPQFGSSNHGVHVSGCASPATDNNIVSTSPASRPSSRSAVCWAPLPTTTSSVPVSAQFVVM